jgi:hypothetical protein
MSRAQPELSADRRALLARKGQILYGKSCGTRGRGVCAESFARYQLGLGHVAVVRDLLQFLNSQLDALRANDPEGLLPMTESLTAEIRQLLEDAA